MIPALIGCPYPAIMFLGSPTDRLAVVFGPGNSEWLDRYYFWPIELNYSIVAANSNRRA